MENKPLNLIDKDDMEDISKTLAPKGYTAEDFERDWAEFIAAKKKRQLN